MVDGLELEEILSKLDALTLEKSHGNVTKCIHLYLDNIPDVNSTDTKWKPTQHGYDDSNSVYHYWAKESPYEIAKYQFNLRFFKYVKSGIIFAYPSQFFHTMLGKSTKTAFCVVLIIPR